MLDGEGGFEAITPLPPLNGNKFRSPEGKGDGLIHAQRIGTGISHYSAFTTSGIRAGASAYTLPVPLQLRRQHNKT